METCKEAALASQINTRQPWLNPPGPPKPGAALLAAGASTGGPYRWHPAPCTAPPRPWAPLPVLSCLTCLSPRSQSHPSLQHAPSLSRQLLTQCPSPDLTIWYL